MPAVGRVLSVVGWHAHAYRRMWRGSITVSFLNPIFFLLSIGVLLGTLVDLSNPDLGAVVLGVWPRTRRVPPLAGDTAPIIRMVELLPAPFGPRKPNVSPRATAKSIPSTAVKSP